MLHLSKNDKLEKLTQEHPKLIIKASASWCKPCKQIQPFFEELSESHKNFTFCVLDVNKCDELSETLKIRSLPTFIRIEDGKEQSRVIGADRNKVQKLLA